MSSEYSLKIDRGSKTEQPQSNTAGLQAGLLSSESHQHFDGQDLKNMIWAGFMWLERHKETVNALNVFPVPDGDTGTNMHLTMLASWREIEKSDETDISRVAQAVAQGALMGARGNSGVILSQILRGVSHAFRHKSIATADDLVEAFHSASDTAYKGVVKPVEGTILTVMKDSADAAGRAAAVDKDLHFVMERTVQAAEESVERTPSLLPVLAKAGVVDSGGKGLYYIFDGMLRYLKGGRFEPSAGAIEAPPISDAVAIDPFNLPQARFGFDIQFLIWGTDLEVDSIRQHISEIGDCPLVEGSSTMIKVHVHHFDPSVPLSYGLSQGFLTDVVVENMDAMAAAGFAPDDVLDELSTAPQTLVTASEEKLDGVGVITVAPGSGLGAVFESLLAGFVIPGGQSMNPSTQELVEAIEALPTDEIILLPNNSNVIMAANQAKEMAENRLEKQVEVVPSRTVPQGISAMLAFKPERSLSENVQAMKSSLDQIDTGEVTVAVRDASIDGVEVSQGDVIGLLNHKLTTKGETPEEVVLLLLPQMQIDDAEIITIYFGDQIDSATAKVLGKEVQSSHPDQELEIVSGGQPHYHYIISVE
ncbi:MAG: DAK2 domain-containing protein [Chloroflexota bacterium]|nr:DAK2 domain-containing protein [Chloroflexota bacterium]